MAGEYVVRPLSDRTWVGQRPRQTSRFTATWEDTRRLLLFEVERLRGRDLVLGIDVADSDLRLDGEVKARARPSSDAIEVAFESKHGPLLYRADLYDQTPWGSKMLLWQHNVRAVALTLESLRAVERYGVSTSGEQYTGYRQIAAAPATVSPSGAVEVLARVSGLPADVLVAGNEDTLRRALVKARRKAHPDMPTGSRAEWDQITEAAKVLGLE